MSRWSSFRTAGAKNAFRKWVMLLLFLHCSIVINGAIKNSPNFDEIAHLPAGIFSWKFGRFDCYIVNPPLVRTVAGLVGLPAENYNWGLHSTDVGDRPEFQIGLHALTQEKLSLQKRFVLPRIACLLFNIIAFATLLKMGCAYFGRTAALVFLAFFLFCPNIIANSQTIVPDFGALALGLVASAACCKYVLNPSLDAAILSGLAFGLALLSKLTWIVGFVAFPFAACICILILGRDGHYRAFGRRILDFLAFATVALFLLNAGYLFEGSFTRLKDFEFCSEMLGGAGCDSKIHGNRFTETWLGELPVPFPKNYLQGIDFLRYEVERKYWSFLMGTWKFGSWPYYYCLTTLFKTPEATMLAAFIGGCVLVAGIRKGIVEKKALCLLMVLGMPAIFCFLSVSIQGGFNHHHRYVLCIYPPMFALAAYIASPVGVEILRFSIPLLGVKKRSFAIPLAFGLAAVSAASTLRVHPYYTSYFNSLSGGPTNGWRLLCTSNIEWGQDVHLVGQWIKEHSDRRPIVMQLNFFNLSGDFLGVDSTSPPFLPKGASVQQVRASVNETQWWIINVQSLYNHPGFDGLEYLQEIEPTERIAYSYHVYRIDPSPKDVSLPEVPSGNPGHTRQ